MKFADWIQSELDKREWSQADLARLAGINSGTLNNIMTGRRNAGVEICTKIAKAFRVPADEVLSMADLLPKKTARTAIEDRVLELLSRFTENEREQIVEELDIRAERKGRNDDRKVQANR